MVEPVDGIGEALRPEILEDFGWFASSVSTGEQ